MSKDRPSQISQLLSATFDAARLRAPEMHKRWVDCSHKVVGAITDGAIMTVQYLGEIDLVLRAMEDERAETQVSKKPSIDDSQALTYQFYFSELWIGSAYEIFRILNDKRNSDTQVSDIYQDLRLLRIPLEKYQIAQDKKLEVVIEFAAHPSRPGESAITYDRSDPKRCHIMPRRISRRGSAMWVAIDIAGPRERNIERRALSDAILSCFEDFYPSS